MIIMSIDKNQEASGESENDTSENKMPSLKGLIFL